MKRVWIAASAGALAALLMGAVGVQQAAAERGGHSGPGGPSGHGASAPSMSRSSPHVSAQGAVRSAPSSGPRVYSYARRDGHRHGRHFRGGHVVYGLPFYGAYAYGSCDYYYERAMATGSAYWWDRYEACTGDY